MDLKDASLAPEGWSSERPEDNPNYQHFSDMSVYELHIRDFSMSDPEISDEHRGKYTAFAQNGFGSRHLKDLQEAGMTHVHLLPSYDFGSVPEKSEDQLTPQVDLANAQTLRAQEYERRLSFLFNQFCFCVFYLLPPFDALEHFVISAQMLRNLHSIKP